MARQPINEVRSLQTRDAMWKVIRNFADEPFTSRDIQQQTNCSTDQVNSYIRGLYRAEILALVEVREVKGFFKGKKVYRLAKDMGVEAPRVRNDGSFVTQGRGREQMWETMRSMRTFTALDIHVFASTDDHPVAKTEAITYCKILARAGYLQRNGQSFTLIKRTGPKPPMIQRTKSVYDPNLNQVVWTDGGEA